MTEEEITSFVTSLGGVAVMVASEEGGAPEVAWGDSFFFYDPADDTPADRRFPFTTIVTGDYPDFDEASKLDREGVFRLNVSVSKETFDGLFGTTAGEGEREHDFAAFDVPFPHPTYGAQGWVSIVNPGPATSDLARSLIEEAHGRAKEKFNRRSTSR